MDRFSFLSNVESGYIESMYQEYLKDPDSIDAEWKIFFDGFEFANSDYSREGNMGTTTQVSNELNVLNMIAAYRSRGHLFANVNPILPIPKEEPNLDHQNFGLSDEDLDTVFQSGDRIGIGPAPLRKIIKHLKDTYCRTIGAEYKHIREPERTEWLEKFIEERKNSPNFSIDEKKLLLRKLGQANTFENFLHRRFVGQKRFSLEGAEAMIPALDACIRQGAGQNISEFIIGMAHRGRLNVLVNILQKEYDNVFSEFEGRYLSDHDFDGDVKYHLGFSSDLNIEGKNVHLSLVPNPSHLEAVNPVVAGVTRSKMDNLYDGDVEKVCPILIHGDSSIAGQGIIYEMIQMSNLNGYQTGGTVHIIINNQIGFTTDPRDARSSTYCTDIAKVTLSPVFHVNGDDIEAVSYVTRLAMDYRQRYKSDVFVDIICYRKYGHNEGDEPRYTNPILYQAISKHPSPYDVYSKKLINEGSITKAEHDELNNELQAYLRKELEESKVNTYELGVKPTRMWEGTEFYDNYKLETNPDTTVSKDILVELATKISHIPDKINVHKNIKRMFADRLKMVTELDKIDWGMGEALAYATLLNEKYPIRISGQDVERGTFSHRHAVVKDIETEEAYIPHNFINDTQAKISLYNSSLSEFGVMGFEFGYASAAPYVLTIWEAQYGDFGNGAQIIIDQFLTACKTKWQRMNGLVLYLPHGYEGGGPEHSSARMERFLTLCAENNIFVCNLTTPANLFHALRRQLKATTRRPLVIFTPKSLLRYPLCVSSLADFTDSGFQEVYDDVEADPKKVKRVILCSGKVYFDILKVKLENQMDNVALVRVEQIYPTPEEQLNALGKKYKNATSWVWAQEEPENMGPWDFVHRKYKMFNFEVVSRKESASPATASVSLHNQQQEEIVYKSLDLKKEPELIKA